MKFENVTMYCRQKSKEAAQAHIEMTTKVNTKNLVDFGVGYDDKRGWHSWTTRKEWVGKKEMQEDE